jgi:toxin ParE1/3/4
VAEIRIQTAASIRLDEIFNYTREHWGDAKAEEYINGLFATFAKIDRHGVVSHPIPVSFEVDGFFVRYERHFIYWRRLDNGDIGIVTILHEKMHQIERFKDDFGV